jgi:outer membrane biosynthesis protein TonB
MRYVPTVNDDNLKNGLTVSAGLHFAMFLFLFFGLPHLMPPLPEHHGPIPFDIVTIGDITNTRIGDDQEQKASAPAPAAQPKAQPAPPPPQEKAQPPAPKPPEVKPDQQAEALKAINKPMPQVKPAPPAPAVVAKPLPQPDMLASVLKNVAKMKPADAAPNADAKTTTNAPSQAGTGAGTATGPSLGSRLTITEEDALRRQIEQCWNPPVGARNAESLIVEVTIDVNQDRTVANAEIVDKSRYGSDPFFRAAADAAMRAVRSPKCSPLQLNPDKYDQWKHIDFTFDPRDML